RRTPSIYRGFDLEHNREYCRRPAAGTVGEPGRHEIPDRRRQKCAATHISLAPCLLVSLSRAPTHLARLSRRARASRRAYVWCSGARLMKKGRSTVLG